MTEVVKPPAPAFTYKGLVRRVVDGDTLQVDIDLGFKMWLHDQPVRLMRINAPEMTIDKLPNPKGTEARNALAKMLSARSTVVPIGLPVAEIIIATKLDKQDKYRRYLAEMWTKVDGVNLSDWMLANNYAKLVRYRLGRKQAFDSRDRNFPMRALLPSVLAGVTSRYWNDSGWWGDQLSTSECVAYAWTHWLEDGPVTQTSALPPIISPDTLYHSAQKVDEWPGEDYDGTSVRAGAKVLRSLGFISNYHWAESLDDIINAVLHLGPVVLGTNWYEAMFDPDAAGFVHVGGELAGGHAYVLNGVNEKTRTFRIKNSWGRKWGVLGRAYISFDDVARLLHEDGEACIATEVKKAA